MHCVSSYPCDIKSINLPRINWLKQFNYDVGFSDHTSETITPALAIISGASVIEKHFTISRKDKGPDSQFSIEPEELKKLCEKTRNAWLALGRSGFERQQSEKNNKVFRRSLYFIKDLPDGHIIGPNDIKKIRPGMGLPPKYYDHVLGKTLKISVKRGQAVSLNTIKNI